MTTTNNLSIDFGFLSAKAVLHILKRATPSLVRTGDLVTYTLTLTNDGNAAASDVVVHDALPAGISYLTHTASSGVYVVATGDWTIPTVPVGSQTLTITVRVE